MQRVFPFRVPAPWACALVLIILAVPGTAATIDVQNADDDTALQDAFDEANGNNEPENTITFTIMETNPQIDLDAPLTVESGSDLILDGTADGLTIDGSTLIDPMLVVGEDTEVIDIRLNGGLIDIAADKTLTLTTTSNQESTADISGVGGLTKQGTGILFLTGETDYTGVTTISEGTLEFGNIVTDGFGNAALGDIVNEGTLQIDLDGAAIYTGVISGSGGLTKVGEGALVFGGANGVQTYTGDTIVNDGNLTLVEFDDGGTDRFALERSITLQTNTAQGTSGTLTLVTLGDGTSIDFAGAIDGEGTLVKEGPGRLVLTGANTYAGSVSLNTGELQGTSSSISGDVSLANTTELIFDQGFAGTYAGDLSSAGGAATVSKEGTGNLRLSGDNTGFGGTLEVNAGTVTGTTTSLPGNIANAATLVFDQPSNATYSGSITGTGALQKTGGGTLTFSGAQPYTGPTTISGGRLDVDGSLVSAVTVNPGGTLGGTGTITSALNPVTVNGTLAPGNSIGTLSVTGDVVKFAAGSTFEVEIEDASNDLLAVIGEVDIDTGARLVPTFDNLTDLANGIPVQVEVLTASLGFADADEFDVTDDFAFQTVDAIQGTNGLEISIVPGTIGSYEGTPNQNAIATALANAEGDGLDNELDDAIDTLVTSSLSSAQGAQALDDIGGEALSQFTTAQLGLVRRIGDNAQRRVRTVFAGGGSALFGNVQRPASLVASVGPTRSSGRRFSAGAPVFGAQSRSGNIQRRGSVRSFEPEAGKYGLGGWLDGYGGFGSVDGDSNTADADYVIAGATLGFDYRITPNVLVGVGGGWGFTDLDVDDRNADGEANTYHGLAYAGYATPQFHIGLSGHYAFSELETERKISFSTVDQTADGDFDGEAYGGRIEAGVNVAEFYGVLLQPIAHFDFTHIEQDGFRETGSPAFNLNVSSESLDSEVTSVGLRLHGAWPLPERSGIVEPELIARWEHQFGDDERDFTGTLVGDGTATPIALRGADAPTDRYLVHLGWVVSSETGLRTTLGYTGGFASEQMEHSGMLTVQYSW